NSLPLAQVYRLVVLQGRLPRLVGREDGLVPQHPPGLLAAEVDAGVDVLHRVGLHGQVHLVHGRQTLGQNFGHSDSAMDQGVGQPALGQSEPARLQVRPHEVERVLDRRVVRHVERLGRELRVFPHGPIGADERPGRVACVGLLEHGHPVADLQSGK
ncbi:hypothetical protein EGW08_022282, partial [Elysia chlorotica]